MVPDFSVERLFFKTIIDGCFYFVYFQFRSCNQLVESYLMCLSFSIWQYFFFKKLLFLPIMVLFVPFSFKYQKVITSW